MPEPNEVTVFSNGIADFRRRFPVVQGREQVISLAYRRDHIGDVLGSLNVFGPVRVIKPPSVSTHQCRLDHTRHPSSERCHPQPAPVLQRCEDQGMDQGRQRAGDRRDHPRPRLNQGIRPAPRRPERTFLGLYGEDRKLHRFSLDDITDFRSEARLRQRGDRQGPFEELPIDQAGINVRRPDPRHPRWRDRGRRGRRPERDPALRLEDDLPDRGRRRPVPPRSAGDRRQ